MNKKQVIIRIVTDKLRKQPETVLSMYSYVFGNWGSRFVQPIFQCAKTLGFGNLSSLGGHPLTQFGTYFTRSALLICGFPWIKITVLKQHGLFFYPILSGDNYYFEKTMRGQKSMVQKQVSSEPYQNVQLARMFLLGTTCNDSLKFPFQKKITFFFSFIFIQS